MNQHALPLTLPSPVHVLPLYCMLSSSAGGKSNGLPIPKLLLQVCRHSGSNLCCRGACTHARASTRSCPHPSRGLTVGCDGGFVMRIRINHSTPAAPTPTVSFTGVISTLVTRFFLVFFLSSKASRHHSLPAQLINASLYLTLGCISPLAWSDERITPWLFSNKALGSWSGCTNQSSHI